MKDIRSLSLAEIEDYFFFLNEPRYRAEQVFEWLWEKNVTGFDQMTTLPLTLRTKMKNDFFLSHLTTEMVQRSKDGTRKIAFRSTDNDIIEGVLIPAGKRMTACISTQAGCALNCSFCATGKMGFKRNLSSGEIFDQVTETEKLAREVSGKRLSNIVFMGMGEPLLNYKNVMHAISMISSDKGLGYSPARITISTVGITKYIRKLADDMFPVQLAISLHTANNQKRELIMPVAKSIPLTGIADAIKYFHKKTGSRISYEYLLLRDFNDTISDARELARFCRISPCKINLIEYNEVQGSPFKRSDPERMKEFTGFLQSKNLVVNFRRSRGADIDAACGQLAGKHKPV
jgi:23S rRNA (adenine2503-C2)-methyltransferase